jgi:hypothetical protein
VLAIESIEVGASELEAIVRVPDLDNLRTSAAPGLPEAALGLLPELSRHRCENDAGMRFVDELRDTETPHLLEHLTVEMMALAGSPRSLPARTTWDFAADGVGVFRVHIAFDDDLVALGALKEAAALVDWLWGEGQRPDVQDAVERLRAVRRAS